MSVARYSIAETVGISAASIVIFRNIYRVVSPEFGNTSETVQRRGSIYIDLGLGFGLSIVQMVIGQCQVIIQPYCDNDLSRCRILYRRARLCHIGRPGLHLVRFDYTTVYGTHVLLACDYWGDIIWIWMWVTRSFLYVPSSVCQKIWSSEHALPATLQSEQHFPVVISTLATTLGWWPYPPSKRSWSFRSTLISCGQMRRRYVLGRDGQIFMHNGPIFRHPRGPVGDPIPQPNRDDGLP